MESTAPVFDVSPENFQSEVMERSRSMPVLLLFWAQQVPPSAEARRTLESLVGGYAGKVALGLVDVARDQMLAQQLRVQGLPSIRVVQDGQLAGQMDGPQTDSAYRELLDQLTLSSGEVLHAQLEHVLASGDFDTALGLLQQAINEEPNNQAFRCELADVLVRKGDLEDARQVLAGVPENTEERKRPQARLEFAEEAAGLDDAQTLAARVQADEGDLEAAYALAVRLVEAEQYEQALELALDILRRDRTFREDIGRLTLIRIFDVLGKGAPLAGTYRRRMFNFMH